MHGAGAGMSQLAWSATALPPFLMWGGVCVGDLCLSESRGFAKTLVTVSGEGVQMTEQKLHSELPTRSL